jgi:hypothetical protein
MLTKQLESLVVVASTISNKVLELASNLVLTIDHKKVMLHLITSIRSVRVAQSKNDYL